MFELSFCFFVRNHRFRGKSRRTAKSHGFDANLWFVVPCHALAADVRKICFYWFWCLSVELTAQLIEKQQNSRDENLQWRTNVRHTTKPLVQRTEKKQKVGDWKLHCWMSFNKNNQVSGLTHWEATNKWRLELALASELETNNQASGSTDWEATTKWRLELALANSLQTNSQTSGAIDWQATKKQRLELGMPN